MEDRPTRPSDHPTSPDPGSERDGDLDARLKAAQARAKPVEQPKPTGEIGMAMRVAVDLVAGLVVGVVIGLALDYWLGTGPWLLLLFFVLGSAAGIRNVMRTARKLEAAIRDRTDDRL